MNILIFRTAAHQLNVNTYNSQEIGLAKAFFKKGHNCDIIYYSKKENRTQIICENGNNCVKIYWSRAIPLLRSGFYPQYNKKNFLNNYDLIIVSEYNQIMSLLVAKKHDKGKTFVYNGPYYNMFHIPFMNYIYDFFFKNSFKKYVDLFLCKSPLSQEYLNKRGLTNNILLGVGTTIEESEFKINLENIDPKFELVKNCDYILYVGSINKRKNFPFLVEVFKEICNENNNVKLVIVGSGKEKFIKKYMGNLDQNIKKRIVHIPRIPNNYMPEVYRNSCCFMLPSKKEIFGMVLLEAMYFGSPVFSSYNGGALTLIENGKNGFIFNNYDKKIWAKAFMKFYANDTKRRIIVANANETIKNKFMRDSLCDKILEKYGASEND